MSIKHRHREIGLAVAFIVIVAVILTFARQNVGAFEKAVVAQTQQHLINTARSEAQSIESFILNVQDELGMLAQYPDVRRAIIHNESEKDISDSSSYSPTKALYEHLAGRINALYRLDANGVIQSRIPWRENIRGVDYSHKPGIKNVLKTHEPYISEVFESASGPEGISICYPVFEGKMFIGIVRAVILLDVISDMVQHLQVGRQSHAWVIGYEGNVICHPDDIPTDCTVSTAKDEQEHGHEEDKNEMISAMLSGTYGANTFVSDESPDEKTIMGWAPVRIGKKMWSIGVCMNYEEVSAPVIAHSIHIFTAAVSLILAFVAIAAGFYKLSKKKILLEAEAKSAGRLKIINQQLQSEVMDRKQAEEDLKQAKERAESAQTKLEQANEQLEASVGHANNLAQKATIADLAKSQFLANMSHEIRTPMNAIIGFSQILAEENLTSEQKRHIDIIRESAEHLLQLINDILDFSKIEAGKLNIKISECSLEHSFATVESLMRPQAMEKGLDFQIVQRGQLPAQICSDPTRLHQCLINLINNAIKFTNEGHVYVYVSIREIGNKPYICFDVEDTGIGIPSEKLELIFKEFQQVDSSTTRIYSGTGLGLPITKKLAHLLGGELTVSSEVSKGSVFSLIIPANVDVKSRPLFNKYKHVIELNQMPVPAPPEQDKLSGSVLVAEDSKSNQELIKLLLERFGVEVTIAEDGKEAVDKALDQQFDLIFMDIQMPRMDGYQATKLLRRKGLKTAIVALTAYAMSGDYERCISAGCDEYLSKPINNELLLDMIKKYLPSKSEPLTERIDSAKSEVDQLSRHCSDGASRERESAGPLEEKGCETPVDCAAIMKNYQDEELIEKVVKVILAEGPQILESLAEAVREKDSKNIAFSAHKLNGMARHIWARRLSEKILRIECAGREENIESVALLFDEMKSEFEKVFSFLSKADWNETAKHQQENGQVEPLVTNFKTLE